MSSATRLLPRNKRATEKLQKDTTGPVSRTGPKFKDRKQKWHAVGSDESRSKEVGKNTTTVSSRLYVEVWLPTELPQASVDRNGELMCVDPLLLKFNAVVMRSILPDFLSQSLHLKYHQ